MKALTILLLIISLQLNGQRISKSDKIVIGIGAIGLTTNFMFYELKSDQDSFYKAGISFLCLSAPIIKLIFDDKLKGVHVTSCGINIDLKYKRYKCKYNPYKKHSRLKINNI